MLEGSLPNAHSHYRHIRARICIIITATQKLDSASVNVALPAKSASVRTEAAPPKKTP